MINVFLNPRYNNNCSFCRNNSGFSALLDRCDYNINLCMDKI